MRHILHILFNLFVKPFYKVNAGFFLFSFILLFGIVNPGTLISYHVSLILGMLQAPLFMAIVLVCWLLYGLKCIFFCNRLILKPENGFLCNLQTRPFPEQWVLFLVNHVLLYLPVLVYSFFVIGLAFAKGHFGTAWGLIGYQSLLCATGATVCCYRLNSSWVRSKTSSWVARLSGASARSGRHYLFYLLLYTAHRRKMSLAVIKLFSFFLLYVLFGLNGNDFELDIFLVLFLMIIAAHAVLIFYYVTFMERQLSFYRNLPLSLLHIGLLYAGTYLVLLLPEFLYLLVNARRVLPVPDMIAFYLVAVVNLYLFTALLYIGHMRMRRYLQIVFAVFFVSIFILKLKYYFVAVAAEGLLAAAVFASNYYRYELPVALP